MKYEYTIPAKKEDGTWKSYSGTHIRGTRACCQVPLLPLRLRTRGFLTSDGEFVSRADAWKIAKAAGQVCGPETGLLTSEDLY